MSLSLGSAGGSVKEIRSVRNACAVLEVVAAQQPIGVSELARLTGIDKSAVHRIAVTLHSAGWIRPHRLPPTRWEIAPSNPVLRHAATLSWEAEARPLMESLRDQSNETVILVRRDEDRLVIAAATESRQPIRLSPTVGFVLPVEGSAALAAIAAHLPTGELARLRTMSPGLTDRVLDTVRRRGWAANDREVVEGVRAVAGAILTSDGYPIGALAVCGPATRVARDDLPRLGSMVADAAGRVFTDRPAPHQ